MSSYNIKVRKKGSRIHKPKNQSQDNKKPFYEPLTRSEGYFNTLVIIQSQDNKKPLYEPLTRSEGYFNTLGGCQGEKRYRRPFTVEDKERPLTTSKTKTLLCKGQGIYRLPLCLTASVTGQGTSPLWG